ncbi:hypothetical protein LCGC14_0734540 [marine sediment metagenome]|uniref:Uncharacterized protein n=1 Tax=marine sediment metagenome TaxID=412755 RepID=A0A0F9TFU1_9ZZZZ
MITKKVREAHDEVMRLEAERRPYYPRGEKVPLWLVEQLNVARAELREARKAGRKGGENG